MYVLFLFLWIVFNGQFTWEIFFVGAVISAMLYWFVCKFMEYSPKKDLQALMSIGKVIRYIAVLIWEIVKANTQVIYFILTSKYEIEPQLVSFRTDLKDELSRAVLANSITLTPGTITVTLTEDEYVVHCLDKSMAEVMDNSVFVKQLRNIEKSGHSTKGSSRKSHKR